MWFSRLLTLVGIADVGTTSVQLLEEDNNKKLSVFPVFAVIVVLYGIHRWAR